MAAAQTTPVAGDVEANTAQHFALAEAARAEGAEIVVFPELSLTGYELHLADRLAFSEGDPRLAPFVDLASALSAILVVGAPLRIGHELRIAAFIVLPNGKIDVHTKSHLGAFSSDANPGGAVPPAEDTVFRPGARNELVAFNGTSAAVGICAESLRKAHPDSAASRGATVYLTSHFGIPLDVGFRARVLRGHAARNSMVVVFSNYGGPTGGLPAGGKSAIWSERGEVVAEFPASGAGVVVATRRDAEWTGKTVGLGG